MVNNGWKRMKKKILLLFIVEEVRVELDQYAVHGFFIFKSNFKYILYLINIFNIFF
jgi:hypothetical protein